MSDGNKGSFDRKMLQEARALPSIREKSVVGILLAGIACSPGVKTAPGNGMEQNIPRELMLVAALRGGGDPNETIYQSRLEPGQ